MNTSTGLTEKTEIVPARPQDMNFILLMAARDHLDTYNATYKGFAVAKKGDEIIGFGRLKNHGTFVEMGTFDVLPGYRSQGIGHKLMNHLIDKAKGEVYLLTTIPEYAYRFGFRLLDKVPPFVQPQFDACTKANYPNKVHLLLRKPHASNTFCNR